MMVGAEAEEPSALMSVASEKRLMTCLRWRLGKNEAICDMRAFAFASERKTSLAPFIRRRAPPGRAAGAGGCGKSKIYGDYMGTMFILKFLDLVHTSEYT